MYQPEQRQGDRFDPELAGRAYNSFKGKYCSTTRDPWMQSRFAIEPGFLNWLVAIRSRQGKEVSLADLKSEIRNDCHRAGDLWQEFLDAHNSDSKCDRWQDILTHQDLDHWHQQNKKRAAWLRSD